MIRFRQDTLVTNELGESKFAGDMGTFERSRKTPRQRRSDVGRDDLKTAEIIALYTKRFTTEENLRDTKDLRFGLGLAATHVGSPDRRDRLLVLCALFQALLTLLGAACERTGLDRRLKANTSKKRTHSLFRQGLFWYSAIPTMQGEWFEPLMMAFEEMLREHAGFTAIFASM